MSSGQAEVLYGTEPIERWGSLIPKGHMGPKRGKLNDPTNNPTGLHARRQDIGIQA